MKDEIFRLHNEGLSYNQIVERLGCSKSTVGYYLGDGQKEKTRERTNKRRASNPILSKLDQYKSRKGLYNKTNKFNIRHLDGSAKDKCTENFNIRDVGLKFGESPVCYLTGESIDLSKPNTYTFDHIIPSSKGGDNSLDNLGLTLKEANQAKSDMSVDALLDLCEKILRHHNRM